MQRLFLSRMFYVIVDANWQEIICKMYFYVCIVLVVNGGMNTTVRNANRVILNIILTTPTPHICKKYAPKICHTMGVRMA